MVQIVILSKFSIPYGVFPDDEKHRGATSREESQACLSCPKARVLQGVSQGAYLGIVPHTHLIFYRAKIRIIFLTIVQMQELI